MGPHDTRCRCHCWCNVLLALGSGTKVANSNTLRNLFHRPENSFRTSRTASLTPWCGSKKPRGERSEEHTSELQSQSNLVCRLLLAKTTASAYLRRSAGVSLVRRSPAVRS